MDQASRTRLRYAGNVRCAIYQVWQPANTPDYQNRWNNPMNEVSPKACDQHPDWLNNKTRYNSRGKPGPIPYEPPSIYNGSSKNRNHRSTPCEGMA